MEAIRLASPVRDGVPEGEQAKVAASLEFRRGAGCHLRAVSKPARGPNGPLSIRFVFEPLEQRMQWQVERARELS
jgi:hypothetical protein